MRNATTLIILLLVMLEAPLWLNAADTDLPNNIALRSVLMDRLVNGKDDGISLLYCLGPWLAPLGDVTGEQTTPFDPLGDLIGEVKNGGFTQYFFNSSGNDWKRVIEALDIIGDQEGKTLFMSAVKIFGEKGPAEDRTLRQKQLDGLTAREIALLDQLDRRLWEHDKALGECLKKWMRKNHASLRILPKPDVIRSFSFTGLAMSVEKSDWLTPLEEICEKAPRNHSFGKDSSGDCSDLSVVHSCLMKPRDEMAIIAIQAQDPALKVMLDSLAPVAAGIHLRCIVIGTNAHLGDYAKADWLITLQGTEKADLELLKVWLGNRLFEGVP